MVWCGYDSNSTGSIKNCRNGTTEKSVVGLSKETPPNLSILDKIGDKFDEIVSEIEAFLGGRLPAHPAWFFITLGFLLAPQILRYVSHSTEELIRKYFGVYTWIHGNKNCLDMVEDQDQIPVWENISAKSKDNRTRRKRGKESRDTLT